MKTAATPVETESKKNAAWAPPVHSSQFQLRVRMQKNGQLTTIRCCCILLLTLSRQTFSLKCAFLPLKRFFEPYVTKFH